MDYQQNLFLRILNWLSQGLHTFALGSSDISTSGRIGYMNESKNVSKYWKSLKWVVDNTFYLIEGKGTEDKGHCYTALQNDRGENYDLGFNPPNLYTLILLPLIIIPVCILFYIPFLVFFLIKKLIKLVKNV